MKQILDRIRNNKEYQSIIVIICIIIGILFLFRFCLPVVIPFLCAFFIAGCLRPVVDFLIRRLHCSEKLASIVVLLLLAAGIAILCKWGISALVQQLENLILYFPFYRERFLAGLDTCCSYVDSGFHLQSGSSLAYTTQALANIFSDFQTTMLPKLTTGTAVAVKNAFSSILFLFIMLYATLCMLKNYPRLFSRNSIAQHVRQIWEGVVKMIFVYLRAEGIIALLQTLICGIGLRILQYPYFLALGLLIGIVDALPVFGSGTILVPWAIIQLLLGNVKMGIGLLILYGLCTLNRQLLEPRLLGHKLGMSTLMTLFMMYVGYQLFGLFGFLLGPIGYLLGKELYKSHFKNTEENTFD